VFGAGVTLSLQDVQRLALGLRELFDEHFALRGRDGIWRACKCAFCLCDLLKKNAPDPARSFFVQAEVRALIQDIKGVSKFHQKGGIWSVVHLATIVSHPLGPPSWVEAVRRFLNSIANCLKVSWLIYLAVRGSRGEAAYVEHAARNDEGG